MSALVPGTFIVQALALTIDPSIWTQAHAIAWPGPERTVTVLDAHQLAPTDPCISKGKDLVPKSENYSFRMGEACRKLFVVMDLTGGINGGAEAVQLLAYHESFHVAAQMYGAEIPVELLEIDPDIVSEFSEGKYFADFYKQVDLLTSSIISGTPRSCRDLESSYGVLSERARSYLDYKIYWEWPAEFYAQQAVRPHDFEGYKTLRSQLFVGGDPGYELFISGVRAGLALDIALGRSSWQTRVAQGQSMLHLLLSEGGCRARSFSPTVRMRRVEI